MKVVDPMTVAITIKKPKTYWIYTLTYPTGYILSHTEADKAAGRIDGCGDGAAAWAPARFVLTRYDRDSKVDTGLESELLGRSA